MNDMGIGPGYISKDRGSETSGRWIWLGSLWNVSGAVNRNVQCQEAALWLGSEECMRKWV